MHVHVDRLEPDRSDGGVCPGMERDVSGAVRDGMHPMDPNLVATWTGLEVLATLPSVLHGPFRDRADRHDHRIETLLANQHA